MLANDGADFEVREGEVHALLGENGAGKSTLCSVLTGLYRPDAGVLLRRGEPVVLHAPRDALRLGIGIVHQDFRLVETMTVAENIVLGTGQRPSSVDLSSTGMRLDLSARVWQLSVGEQQRVEIARMLLRGIDVLILDEPTAVLTPQEAEELFAQVRRMAAEGKAIVLISHKLRDVLGVSDRVTVMRDGRTLQTMATADASAAELARLMVGRPVTSAVRRAQAPPGPVVLAASGLWARGDRHTDAVRDVDLEVRAGEVLGIAGVAGNGQLELVEVLAGLRPAAAGRVTLAGRDVTRASPRGRAGAGMAYIPEGRLRTGLAGALPIQDNLALRAYRAGGPLLDRRGMRRRAEALMASFGVRAPGPDAVTRTLSGGNLQKVVLARELSEEPVVVVAASPTRGLDVAATEAVRERLDAQRGRGAGILLVSEDLDEVLSLSDRIAVMYEGRLVGLRDARDTRPEELGLLMAGAT